MSIEREREGRKEIEWRKRKTGEEIENGREEEKKCCG